MSLDPTRHGFSGPDFRVPAERPAAVAGLSQRQAERSPTRAAKPPKEFRASLRLSAEDLADALAKSDRLEDAARECGLEVKVYAIGGGELDD
jgi:hypothetical protein